MLPQATMEALVSQYRSEVSATQVYEQALAKYAGQPEERMLLRLHGEHRHAVRRLGEAIRQHGGVVPDNSGAWGAFAVVLERLAGMVSDVVPLHVLHRSEVISAGGYEKLIREPGLSLELGGELQALQQRAVGHQETLAAMIREVPELPNRPML